jgi:hypothetical protein
MHVTPRTPSGMNRCPVLFEVRDEGTELPRATQPDTGPSREDVSDVAEEKYRGASVRTLPRANKQYSAGRVCADPNCETKLSRYNKWQYCWQHEPVHTYVPRGKRRSRTQAA